jgi:glycosyltransferase involved in cell wall biosynthesis
VSVVNVCILGDPRSVHLQRIVPGLVERGLRVRVICHKPAEIEGATVERFAVPGPSLRRPFRWTARWTRYLGTLMRTHDVVHVHFLHDWGFTPEVLDRGCFVATPWGSDVTPPPGEQRADAALVAKRVMMLQHAAMVTSWGPTFAKTIAAYADIDAPGIELLPLGVDLNLFRPPVQRVHRPAGAFKVGFFKGFREVYGPTVLMRAIPTVVEALPGTRFHLIGDGPLLEKCEQLAALHEVTASIKWIRRQPHANMPNHLAGWNLSVIPSFCESFGAAAVESSAMQVPVVASNVGGLPDTVIDGETGMLVTPGAPEQLAGAIIHLLRDPSLRINMGLSGRKMAEEHFDWSRILDDWVTTYHHARDRVCAMV